MPIVRISWFSGRTKEQKAKIAKEIEESIQKHTGCPAGATYIMFEDIPKEDWAIKGELQA